MKKNSTLYQRARQTFRPIYNFLSSVKLALTLLVVILACCVMGVTLFRGERAWTLIFNTLWFNGILVLLVINVAFCFFPRIRGRKLTLISLGMILFHLSFVALLGGIIYNSLFYFHGTIRLTEGESLANGDLQNYDNSTHGRFFDLSKLQGETTLVKMHPQYQVEGKDKIVGYEITVGRENLNKHGVVYITRHLDYRGFRYYTDREGYSLLVILYSKQGKELYGAYVPLQSLKQEDGTYRYTTGTKNGPGALPFPAAPAESLYYMQVAYMPPASEEKAGNASFILWSFSKPEPKALTTGMAALGEKIKVGDRELAVKEVRYWAAMIVRYDPGQPIVLASLGAGLGGMIMTFIGRMKRTSA